MNPKLIRECRMGLPKCFKTGAVVGTYPKPLLYLQFDREGISVIPRKGVFPGQGEIPLDSNYEDIFFQTPGKLGNLCKEPTQPKITCIDYTVGQTIDLELSFTPPKLSKPFQDFLYDYNAAASHIRTAGSVPWKTVVFDSVSGYEDLLMVHMSSFNPAALNDARQWAGQIGGKVRQTILTMTTWPCHIVFIMHSMMEKNEMTGAVSEVPNVFSSLRGDIAGMFSQFFYAVKLNGQPKLWPHDKMFVRGVGARWPSNLGQEISPDFNSIYGREGLV